MPKCKNCEDKFKPRFKTTEKYCWKDECKSVEIDLMLSKKRESDKKQQKKEWAKEKKEKSPSLYPVKYRKVLAEECQKLARMIDNRFGLLCIDCGKPYGKQQDGGHFNSKGKNASIQWNLHNIHSQRSDCNRNGLGGGRERQYYDGLIKRYGNKYAEYVDVGIQKKYEYVGLLGSEIYEKLVIVRKIIRDFETFHLTDPISARILFNNIIGIYKDNVGLIDFIENEEDYKLNMLF